MDMEQWYDGENMKILCSDENCTVYQIKDKTGEGLMTMYPVFEGCFILFNDFHLEKCCSGFAPKADLFCIDHCREGRIEWQKNANKYTYVSAGDMQVDCRTDHSGNFFFPLGHYHGVTISIDLGYTDNGRLKMMDDFIVDLNKLKQKFCPKEQHFIMRASSQIDRIFAELYDLPENIRKTYFKIKIMELFLFLENLDVPEGGEERSYFYKTQVDKVKEMVRLQTEDLTRWYTLEELSKKFEFPLTGMKQCFKGIYGCSMADYMKTYRMNAAAEMLYNTDKTVIEIASSVGYENPGKFAGVFKSKMGMTPSAYRNTLTK